SSTLRTRALMTVVTPELRPAAPVPAPEFPGEAERIQVLRDYALESLENDPELASIARFAAKLCDTPYALVSLVEEERQRFLAREGLTASETPREISFCTHAMQGSGLMEVRDATRDPRFAGNPLVTAGPRLRFYAGQPLKSEEGLPLGTLCVLDTALRSAPRGHACAATPHSLSRRRQAVRSAPYACAPPRGARPGSTRASGKGLRSLPRQRCAGCERAATAQRRARNTRSG